MCEQFSTARNIAAIFRAVDKYAAPPPEGYVSHEKETSRKCPIRSTQIELVSIDSQGRVC